MRLSLAFVPSGTLIQPPVLRHLGAGLSGSDHLNAIEIGQAVTAAIDAQDFPSRFAVAFDVRQDGLNGIGRFKRGVKNV
jgi:hypothetical protein